MKNILIVSGVAALLLVGGARWSKASQSSDPNIISVSGLHWHPQIDIYAGGEKQDVPANIGIGAQYASAPTFDPRMGMTAMHTHEPDGTIHLEFSGIVRKEDTTLSNFFRIWGNDMTGDFGSLERMTVNGAEVLERDEYEMKDGDRIELYYQ